MPQGAAAVLTAVIETELVGLTHPRLHEVLRVSGVRAQAPLALGLLCALRRKHVAVYRGGGRERLRQKYLERTHYFERRLREREKILTSNMGNQGTGGNRKSLPSCIAQKRVAEREAHHHA